MHGLTPNQEKLIKAIAAGIGDGPFTIGLACDKAGVTAEVCEKEFPAICAVGALRCPVNDGGMALYQIAPDIARSLNVIS